MFKWKGVIHTEETLMRNILLQANGLTPEQQQMIDYERCYTGDLFADKTGDWEQDYDDFGRYVPSSDRKPYYIDPLGREIVDTFTAALFGYEQFPEILANSYDNLFSEDLFAEEQAKTLSPYEIPKGKSERELELRKLGGKHLQRFANAVLSPETIGPLAIKATRYALIAGRSIAVYKFVQGKIFTEVIDYKWVKDLTFSDDDPEAISSFTESYMYEADDPDFVGRKKKYWFRRDFNEEEEILYFPAEHRVNMPPVFRVKDKKKHGLGCCPAVLFEAPDANSIFMGQVGNLKAYTYLTNFIFSGIKQDMRPQWAGLKENPQMPVDNSAKIPGGVWIFENLKQLVSLSPSHQGYDSARQFRKELRDETMHACKVESTQGNSTGNHYQSGTAIQQRMAPLKNAIGEYRIWFGERSLVRFASMLLCSVIRKNKAKEQVVLRQKVLIPDSEDFVVSLSWGQMSPATEDDIMKKITNAVTAEQAQLVELEDAIRYVAPYMNVVNVEEKISILRKQREERQAQLDAVERLGKARNMQSNVVKDMLKAKENKKIEKKPN